MIILSDPLDIALAAHLQDVLEGCCWACRKVFSEASRRCTVLFVVFVLGQCRVVKFSDDEGCRVGCAKWCFVIVLVVV